MAILLAPVGPHLAEQLWTLAGESGFVINARWPAATQSNSSLLGRMENYFEGSFRTKKKSVF
jgi:leucyl-tRNA synthetase